MTEVALACEGLTKVYGGLKAVNDVSFHVDRNEVFAIIGPNGAGKTTLFEVISGLSRPTAGVVRLNGEEIQDRPPDEICRLAMLRSFQTSTNFQSLSVLSNVMIGAVYGRGEKHRFTFSFDDDAIAAAMQALEACSLLDKQDVEADLLSVLDKKRLMLATALATECDILLLDEPVGGLNVQERQDYLDLVRELNEAGTTIVMVEHVMDAVRQLADRMMVMNHGENILEGVPAEVLADERVIEVYLGEDGAGAEPPGEPSG